MMYDTCDFATTSNRKTGNSLSIWALFTVMTWPLQSLDVQAPIKRPSNCSLYPNFKKRTYNKKWCCAKRDSERFVRCGILHTYKALRCDTITISELIPENKDTQKRIWNNINRGSCYTEISSLELQCKEVKCHKKSKKM